jgi:methylated-DNA-[protein]-cysteine S-methyltransferase
VPDFTYYCSLSTPVGELLLVSNGQALTQVHLPPHRQTFVPGKDWQRDDVALREACRQLRAYFAGELRAFDLMLAPAGTDFQRRVWAELSRIPFGTTRSYADVARRIGQPTASRAVGSANGRNPLPIIIPCHRVISADGTLGGYGGGLDCKRWLLRHEGVEVRGNELPSLFGWLTAPDPRGSATGRLGDPAAKRR